MITGEEFKKMIFESTDLSVFVAFAKDVPIARTQFFHDVGSVRELSSFENTVPTTDTSPTASSLSPLATNINAFPRATPLATSPAVAPVPKPTSPTSHPFEFGDFGSIVAGGTDTRQVRSSSVVIPPPAEVENNSTFGDFAFFVPKSDAPNKLEQSFNRSMVRRNSSVLHKKLDELEDVTDEADTDNGTFSFSDFSLTSSDDVDDRPSSRGYRPDDDTAFMFGDFVVAMPDKERRPTNTLAAKPPAGPAQTKSFIRPAQATPINRQIRRPQIIYGALMREVKVRSLLGHPTRIRGAVIAAQTENCFISAGGDHFATLRSTSAPHPLSIYFGHNDAILHIAISADHSLIATSGSDNLLSIFEASTNKKVGDCSHTVAVLCSTFSKNGKYIVSGSQDGICRLWASKKKSQTTPMSSYFGHKSLVTCVSFQPNGELVASGAGDTQVHLWSASTGKVSQSIQKVHTSAVMNVGFSNDGSMVLSCDTAKVALSDCKTGCLLTLMDSANRGGPSSKFFFTGAAFAPQGSFPNYFFICGSDRSVSLHEFLVGPSSGVTSPRTTAKGAKETKPTPDVAVTISPEIWSCESRHKVTVITTGPKQSMLLGDLGGNVMMITLVPRQPELLPPPRVVKKKTPPGGKAD